MSPTKIKICGITCAEDALEAIKCGADFLGFNFYPRSPRYIKPQRVKGILEYLRIQGVDRVFGVGVFVNEPPENIQSILGQCGLKIAQLHGQEPPESIAQLKGLLRIKAVKVAGEQWAESLPSYGADAYLAEAPHPTLAGGSGESYDYSLVAPAARAHKVFLAGGLTPATVGEAVQIVRPFAVDVASGVERIPGRKDPGRMHEFCQAVREADASG